MVIEKIIKIEEILKNFAQKSQGASESDKIKKNQKKSKVKKKK